MPETFYIGITIAALFLCSYAAMWNIMRERKIRDYLKHRYQYLTLLSKLDLTTYRSAIDELDALAYELHIDEREWRVLK